MASTRSKPRKPYPTFPLTRHPNGQWCKKIRGNVRFFGVWSDPEGALQRYHASAADLHAGRPASKVTLGGDELTVKDVCNTFLGWQRERLNSNEIGLRWFEDCRSILAEFARSMGKSSAVSELRPGDFERHRNRLSRRLGVHAVARHLTIIKAAFRYARESDLIENEVRFGPGFVRPSAVQVRREKRKKADLHGARMFDQSQVLMMLSSCQGWLRAAILLGINGGLGNTDCALLPISAVAFDEGVIDFPRPKTGIERVVPLWPETLEALGEILKSRPAPESSEAARRVLLTNSGKPIVRQMAREREDGTVRVSNQDDLSDAFAELLKSLSLRRRGLGFYSLRHTFRTWADEVRDQHAIHRIMGHTIPGMSGIYVEEISLARLRAVTDHVRSKLWPSE